MSLLSLVTLTVLEGTQRAHELNTISSHLIKYTLQLVTLKTHTQISHSSFKYNIQFSVPSMIHSLSPPFR